MTVRRGRREDPIRAPRTVPGAFAQSLRDLREHAGGPSYRELAGRSRYSAATLANATRGDRLPTLPVVLAFARACGADLDDWRRRWENAVSWETARRDRTVSGPLWSASAVGRHRPNAASMVRARW
jgi:transcriptional regulator with XRE-family HTH domain